MLLLVTVGLVLAGLILLIVGFVQDSLTLIYLSIACAAVAGLALIVFSRLSRRGAVTVAAEGIPAAAASPSPLVTAGVGPAHAGRTMESAPPAPRPATVARSGAGSEPREPVVSRQASAHEEDRFHPGEPTPPQAVRAAAPAAPAATTRLEQVRPPEPVPVAADAGASGDDEWEVDWGDEVLFPIEDYDELRVAEIVPLLPELDPDELEEVRDREAATKNRASILARIDELTGNTTPPPAKPAPRKAPAAKSAPPKAPAASKPAATKKAAAATKASASKAASKAAEPVKAAAKATRAGAADTAKAAARKAPSKSAPAAAKAQAGTKKAAAKEAPAKTAAKKATPAKQTGTAKKAGASKSAPRKRS